jgi:acyl-coenzyme A thioesterase 9
MRSSRPLSSLRNAKLMASASHNARNCNGAMQQLHTSPAYHTDGVYKDLTSMRVRTPWIEALRKQREEGLGPTKKPNTPATPPDRDLKPKRMSDSYHRVVRIALCDVGST